MINQSDNTAILICIKQIPSLSYRNVQRICQIKLHRIRFSSNDRINSWFHSISEYQRTISQSTDLKKGWWIISTKPVSRRQPKRSAGFLFRNPFKTDEAFTDSDLGMRIVFSRITEMKLHYYRLILSQFSFQLHSTFKQIDTQLSKRK